MVHAHYWGPTTTTTTTATATTATTTAICKCFLRRPIICVRRLTRCAAIIEPIRYKRSVVCTLWIFPASILKRNGRREKLESGNRAVRRSVNVNVDERVAILFAVIGFTPLRHLYCKCTFAHFWLISPGRRTRRNSRSGRHHHADRIHIRLRYPIGESASNPNTTSTSTHDNLNLD